MLIYFWFCKMYWYVRAVNFLPGACVVLFCSYLFFYLIYDTLCCIKLKFFFCNLIDQLFSLYIMGFVPFLLHLPPLIIKQQSSVFSIDFRILISEMKKTTTYRVLICSSEGSRVGRHRGKLIQSELLPLWSQQCPTQIPERGENDHVRDRPLGWVGDLRRPPVVKHVYRMVPLPLIANIQSQRVSPSDRAATMWLTHH